MDHLKILQSNGILKNADSYILTNREKLELIDAFNSLSKINKIDLHKKANFDPNDSRDIESIKWVSKNLTLKEMINLSLTNKKMRETMIPIIKNKRNSLEELRVWLNGLPDPLYYTIENLDQMKILDLNDNQLTSLPNLNLPNLQILALSNNQLTSIPEFALNLPNLRYLFIYNNQLTEFPNLNLPNLKELHLYNNQLTSFPNLNLLNLPNLQQLYLNNNQLTSIPSLTLSNLPNLRELALNDNKLTEIPNLNLPNLKELYLKNNQLISIPNINLPKLKILDLEQNPLPETEKARLRSIYGHKVIL